MGTADRRRAGFTLIELMVVIVIIAILVSISIGVVQGIISRARTTRTEGLIMVLSTACDSYRTDFDIYPPGQGSRALHQALGGDRRLRIVTGDPPIYVKKGPLVEFRTGWLERGAPSLQPPPASAIVDAWGNEINYRNPGQNRPKQVDIWSEGAKSNTDADDITNWIQK